MRRAEVVAASAVLAAVGFGLVLWQAIRTISGDPLGASGEVVLYVGLGLFLVAAVGVAARRAD